MEKRQTQRHRFLEDKTGLIIVDSSHIRIQYDWMDVFCRLPSGQAKITTNI